MEKENAIYLITGVMAAGKSTIAQLLSERLEKSVHVRGDVFRKMIVNGEVQMSDTPSKEALEQLLLRHQLAAKAADMYFESGFNVVLQDIIIGPMLGDMVEFIKSRPLYVIVLAPRPDIIAAREFSRPKKGYGKIEILSLEKVLQTETPRIGLWIDSSHITPEETVEEIISGLDKEAKIT
ncbi:AAA family ATPase [Bacillus atrophaeus]|uniref:AAA family ATPase n=1 Tax=Bacillus atrophaeus TaxID=1452 RepID=UPI00228206CC|nr:AAA family ATPase [Bacillus atrophaeus]MCY8911708.1 AAA family ATPase [Bacillus atrophaeus]MCY9115226.1 AAA family ATPase [Bacillus atrophaeus]MEC0924723.1 AAA family ATPase [Bacillus atrophaeus]MEC0933337.1 AAA family ATPase [Bacillus atrophaeus]